ncbi:MAG TPA: hypothetical protein VGM64_09825 [Lacunisphaera sp.]|jgi:hypothetical protein
MNLTDELRKLADLHDEGKLTAQEFVDAKSRLLAPPPATVVEAPVPEKSTEVATPPPIEEKTYWSSRWSAGNLFFRDRLVLAGDGITFRKGAMFSSNEEHINYRAIASIRIKNGIFLSNVTVETSGGTQPVFINGLWKSDAKQLQDFIRVYQAS